MKITAALVLLAATAVLTACSSDPETPKVASVPTPSRPTTSAPGTEAPSGTDGGRPRLRLDDSPRRRTAIQVAYNQCLLDHGATGGSGGGADGGSAVAASPGEDENGNPVGPLVAGPVPPEASAACASKLPLEPPELAAATNPDFHRQSLSYVNCLEAGGLHVTLLNHTDLDWTYTEGHTVPDDTARLERDCLAESFQR